MKCVASVNKDSNKILPGPLIVVVVVGIEISNSEGNNHISTIAYSFTKKQIMP